MGYEGNVELVRELTEDNAALAAENEKLQGRCGAHRWQVLPSDQVKAARCRLHAADGRWQLRTRTPWHDCCA